MAVATYTVKRGDTLDKICRNKSIASKIAGNTVQAKINTLVKVNNLKDPNYIVVGWVLKLSGQTTSVPATDSKAVSLVNIRIGLVSSDTSSKSREVYADWAYDRKNLGKFEYQWTYYDPTVNNGKAVGWVLGEKGETESYTDVYCYSAYSGAPEYATTVCFRVKPIAKTKTDGKGNETYYWTDGKWSNPAYYNFSDNPPVTPPSPTVEIDNETLVLTASISNINAKDLDAVSIKFNIVQDNSTNIHTSQPVTINTTSNYVSYQYTVDPGHTYTVRACSVSGKGKESGWSEFSEGGGTKPSAPSAITTYRRNKRTDGKIAAYLEWTGVPNAKSYKIEYVNIESDFETTPDNIQAKTTENARTSIEIITDSAGLDYYFRIRAINDNGESDPSPVVLLPIGSTPAAPTTYSSSESAFAGDTTYAYDDAGNKYVDYTPMELNWVHNPTDNSKQTFAELSLKIGDNDWISYLIENTTDINNSGERIDRTTFTYGTSISYKGDLYFKMDMNHADLNNKKIQWKVRTAGVTDAFSDTDWSVERTIYIYEKPTLRLSMTSDLAGNGSIIETLTSFPFYIRGQLSLTNYDTQKPVGYHLQIVSNDYYVAVDDIGRTKTVNPGDVVYSKYFDTSETLIVEMSANNIDLESEIGYTVRCVADMSTGLAVDNAHEFTVSWIDVEYAIDADITISTDEYTALITPYCYERIATTVGEGDDAYTTYENGDLVDNITFSIYRREYDGNYTEIATGVPNDGTSVTDPHPALDYARYRFVAKDTLTGAISFWDAPGYPVNGNSVILQWAEEWSTFDTGEETSVEGPAWTGSLLKLPYNIKVTDSRKPEVSFVNYIGRKHPVGYYSTQLSETSSWSVEIPKDDKDTIYALRRLSIWAGDVYVREPSGMGYWANVGVSFSQAYSDVKIPISLDITRVEGGV